MEPARLLSANQRFEYATVDTKDLYAKEREFRTRLLRVPIGIPTLVTDEQYERESSHILILNEADEIKGCVILHPDAAENFVSSRRAQLLQMAVDEDYQGKGVGSALIEECERHARQNGIELIYCHARAYAKGFYLKRGYKITSEEFTEVGIPHYEMEKELSTI